MNAHLSAATQRPGRRLLVSIASTALLATGCSNLISTAPVSNPASSVAAVGGRVHGGNQPVAGATVSLYFAGQTGIGSPATLAATTTTADDNAGSFSFTKLADSDSVNPTSNTFSCPVTTGVPYVYLIARGGNTLNTHNPAVNNTASVFIAPLGYCSQITSSTFVYMSEAVTAATVAAVHQFMNVNTGDIGAGGILVGYAGLQNAFNTVSNLVSLSTGQTLASVPLTGGPSGVTVTASAEQAKLNQVANILSACINNATSAASACTTLFANAVPPFTADTTGRPDIVFSTATDVLQAAFYMFTNPTDLNPTNLANLYNLAPGSGAPYQPTLSAIPSDWTIGVQYVASGSCGSGATAPGFINSPFDINVDRSGNVWVANAQAAGSSLTELSPTGVPLACKAIPGGSRGGTIDSSGNVWVGDSENNMIYRYTPNVGGTSATLAFPTTTAPFALAADGTGNIYYSTVTAGQSSVWIIPNGMGAATPVAPVEISTAVGATPNRILVNGDGSIWASTQDSYVSRIAPAASGSVNFMNGYSTVQFSTPTPSYGITADRLLDIFISAREPSSQLNQLRGSGTSYATAPAFPSAAHAAGITAPTSIASDGARNVWIANAGTDLGTGTPPVGASLISQITAGGATLSPNASSNLGIQTAGGYQKAISFFLNSRTVAIDQAGNVWVGRDGSQQVTEIVGAAVPIFQPYAFGLNQGRFQTIP